MNSTESAEFLYQGATPFALTYCEKFESQPVAGFYNEEQQTWEGSLDISSLTLTLTQTPEGNDNDSD